MPPAPTAEAGAGDSPDKPTSPAPPAAAKGKAGAEDLTEADAALLDRVAEAVVRHRMTVPAILLLESVKPLSFLGSQSLYFFEPMVRAFFSVPDYDRVAALLERRESVEWLLVRIEAKDDEARRNERDEKARRREARRTGTDRKEPK